MKAAFFMLVVFPFVSLLFSACLAIIDPEGKEDDNGFRSDY